MDFGLARARHRRAPARRRSRPRDQTDRARPAPAALMGTPAYMAPEQWEGLEPTRAPIEVRVLRRLWEALYGSRPFRGETPSALMLQAITRGHLTPPRDARRAPPWLRRLLEGGLAVVPWRALAVDESPHCSPSSTRDHRAPRGGRLGVLFIGIPALVAAALAARRIDERRRRGRGGGEDRGAASAPRGAGRRAARPAPKGATARSWRLLDRESAHERLTSSPMLALEASRAVRPRASRRRRVVIDAAHGGHAGHAAGGCRPPDAQWKEKSPLGLVEVFRFFSAASYSPSSSSAADVELVDFRSGASGRHGRDRRGQPRVRADQPRQPLHRRPATTTAAPSIRSTAARATSRCPAVTTSMFAPDDSRFFALKAHTVADRAPNLHLAVRLPSVSLPAAWTAG